MLSFQLNGRQKLTMTIKNTNSYRARHSPVPCLCFLHPLPNELLALEFLSQLASGRTWTKMGLFPGLVYLGHRAWTSSWFFPWFYLNQITSPFVFICWSQKSGLGGSDSSIRSLETCSYRSSHVQDLEGLLGKGRDASVSPKDLGNGARLANVHWVLYVPAIA